MVFSSLKRLTFICLEKSLTKTNSRLIITSNYLTLTMIRQFNIKSLTKYVLGRIENREKKEKKLIKC